MQTIGSVDKPTRQDPIADALAHSVHSRHLLQLCIALYVTGSLLFGGLMVWADSSHWAGHYLLWWALPLAGVGLAARELPLRKAVCLSLSLMLLSHCVGNLLIFPKDSLMALCLFLAPTGTTLFHRQIPARIRHRFIALALATFVATMINPLQLPSLQTTSQALHILQIGVVAASMTAMVILLEAFIRTLNRQQDSVMALASIDPLSGALNRRALGHHATEMLERIAERHSNLGVIMADIDHFKDINDKHGHAAGDAVIREISERLSRHLPDDALLARWGGEEFVVLCETSDARTLRMLAEHCRRAVGDQSLLLDELQVPVTLSLGVSAFPAAVLDNVELEALIADADVALYAAKRRGRNRVHTRTIQNTPQEAAAHTGAPDAKGKPVSRG